jgi:hypothetical protein
MRLYDCKVLLAGSRDNEVRKTDVTAAEIMILQAFHGADSVTEIVPKEMDKRSHGEERKRLFSAYVGGAETDSLGGFQGERVKVLQNLFGPAHNQLPIELPKPEAFFEEDEAPVAPSRAKQPVKAGKAEDIAAAAALA